MCSSDLQRDRTLYRNVVHAVIDQVSADCVVHPHLEGNLELGAHPIRRAHQNGRFPALQIQPEQRPR